MIIYLHYHFFFFFSIFNTFNNFFGFLHFAYTYHRLHYSSHDICLFFPFSFDYVCDEGFVSLRFEILLVCFLLVCYLSLRYIGLFFNLCTSQGGIGFLTMALAEAVAERCGFWLKVAAQAAVLPLCRRQISRVTQEKHIV